MPKSKPDAVAAQGLPTLGREWRRWIWPALATAGGIATLFAPDVLNLYGLRLATNACMIAVVAQGINLIAGYVGYPAFGNVVFFGLGAYTTAILVLKLQLSVVAGVLASAVLCAASAAVIGPPFFRLRGHYFAIATLGLNEAVKAIVNNLTNLTGGGMGLSLPLPSGTPEESGARFFYAFYGLLLISVLATYLLSTSRLGYACRAIRGAEMAAACAGVNATATKTLVWMISAALTGAAGGTYAHWISYIEPSTVFNMAIAVKAFVIFLLGGPGTILGPIFGAGFIELVSATLWSRFLTYHLGIMGVIVVLTAIFMPGGLRAFVKDRLTALRDLERR